MRQHALASLAHRTDLCTLAKASPPRTERAKPSRSIDSTKGTHERSTYHPVDRRQAPSG